MWCYGWLAYLYLFLHGLFGKSFDSNGSYFMMLQLLTNKYPGMRLWLSQRLSALIMATYIVLLVILLAIFQPANFSDWHALLSPIWFRALTFLFFISLFIHAWLGVSDVFKDYIFNKTLRSYMQILVDILLVVYLIWLSFILWNV